MPGALIAGAGGMVGRAIATRLAELGGWEIIGIARNPHAVPGLRRIALDLTDGAACRRELGALKTVTHVFYAARYDHPEGRPEPVDINAAMLENIVNALPAGGALAHVNAVHGSKYYGHQLGPVKLPMEESDPRAAGANFYFVQEDFLRETARKRGFSFTTVRPHTFCSPDADTPRSIGLAIALYAAVQRELGLPLDFPGSERAFRARTQFTDLALLGRAIAWMATEPRCANEAFNIVNGDNPSWAELWPGFAAWFGVKPGAPRAFTLERYMADKQQLWDGLVRRHGLNAPRLDALVLWQYPAYVFKPEWDIISSAAKARALGFSETVASAAMFARQFERYRAIRIIP